MQGERMLARMYMTKQAEATIQETNTRSMSQNKKLQNPAIPSAAAPMMKMLSADTD